MKNIGLPGEGRGRGGRRPEEVLREPGLPDRLGQACRPHYAGGFDLDESAPRAGPLQAPTGGNGVSGAVV